MVTPCPLFFVPHISLLTFSWSKENVKSSIIWTSEKHVCQDSYIFIFRSGKREFLHMRRFPEPQHFFAAEWQNWDFAIAIIFYPVIKTSWKFLCILFGCCSTQILNFNAKKQFCKYVKNCLKIRVWPNFWIIFNMFAKLVFALKFRIRVLQHPNKMHKNFYKVFITG